jgi:LmbE family N-acetylglucosaminyl deacetylase
MFLKADVKFLEYRDAFIPDGDDPAIAVNRLIRELRPTTVITHWKESSHKDHVRTHHAVMQGIFYAGLDLLDDTLPSHRVGMVLFAENWEDAYNFKPDVFCDISSEYDVWMQSLGCYEIGRERDFGFPYRDYYQCLARLRGCLVGVRYAEAFMMPEPEEIRLLSLSGDWPITQIQR